MKGDMHCRKRNNGIESSEITETRINSRNFSGMTAIDGECNDMCGAEWKHTPTAIYHDPVKAAARLNQP